MRDEGKKKKKKKIFKNFYAIAAARIAYSIMSIKLDIKLWIIFWFYKL